jgi:hypothetical protein
MDIARISKLGEEAVQKISVGDFEVALGLARQIQSIGGHHYISYLVSGLLIDIGSAL